MTGLSRLRIFEAPSRNVPSPPVVNITSAHSMWWLKSNWQTELLKTTKNNVYHSFNSHSMFIHNTLVVKNQRKSSNNKICQTGLNLFVTINFSLEKSTLKHQSFNYRRVSHLWVVSSDAFCSESFSFVYFLWQNHKSQCNETNCIRKFCISSFSGDFFRFLYSLEVSLIEFPKKVLSFFF